MEVEQVAEFVQEQVELALEDEDAPGIRRTESFEEAGVLTRDAGFLITATNGYEYQITIVRSR